MSSPFSNDDQSVDPQQEGTYRRGYHQAVAEVAFALKANLIKTGEELDAWVEGSGMRWRKDLPLNKMLSPPDLNK